jgi:hypothetical protein
MERRPSERHHERPKANSRETAGIGNPKDGKRKRDVQSSHCSVSLRVLLLPAILVGHYPQDVARLRCWRCCDNAQQIANVRYWLLTRWVSCDNEIRLGLRTPGENVTAAGGPFFLWLIAILPKLCNST